MVLKVMMVMTIALMMNDNDDIKCKSQINWFFEHLENQVPQIQLGRSH